MAEVITYYWATIHSIINKKSRSVTNPSDYYNAAIYYYSLCEANSDDGHHLLAEYDPREMINTLFWQKASLSNLTFVRQMPSLARFVSHLFKQKWLTHETEVFLAQVDEYLFAEADRLVPGKSLLQQERLIEIALYFTERFPEGPAAPQVKRLLPRLKAGLAAVNSATAPLFEPITVGPAVPIPTLGTGLVGGLAGVLLKLVELYQIGIQDEVIKDSIRRGIFYLLSCKQPVDFSEKQYAIFPEKVNGKRGESTFSNRLGWCSGDLGQVLLFYRANEIFQDADLEEMAELIGLNTLLRRDQEATGIESSLFCQGAAGVAYLYRKLYLLSKNEGYYRGYQFWLNETCQFLERELTAGFYLNRELNLYDGLTGVGLTLWSHLSEKELSWSNFLWPNPASKLPPLPLVG